MCKKNKKYYSVQIELAIWNFGHVKLIRYDRPFVRVCGKNRDEAIKELSGVLNKRDYEYRILRMYRVS